MLMRKFIALLEVLGVFVVGNYLAQRICLSLGVKSLGAGIQSALASTKPDFGTLSLLWLQTLCVQYACLLAPAFAIGWWRRRFGPAHYGFTRAGKSVWSLVMIGLVAFALVAWPSRMLWLANRFVPLGPQPAIWALIGRTQSWAPSFWIFLAVSSFAVTPFLEELFYRGYCQTRLEEEFGGVGAIVIVALFMTLGHSQYHHWSALSIGQIVSLVPITLGFGYVFWRTRSILPAVILHGAVNVPTKGLYDFLLPATMIAVLVLFRRSWWRATWELCLELAADGRTAPVLGGTLFAIAMTIGFESAPGIFVPLASFGLGIAIIAAARDHRLQAKQGGA